jgi:hypothetical protein
MTLSSSPVLQLTKTLARAGLLALGLAACGSSPEPIGESQQPILGDDSEAPSHDACNDGVAPAEAAAGECTITARGLCFSNHAAACACAGCGLDECAIAESFPEQAVCPSDDGGGSDPDGSVSDDPDAPVSSDPGGGSDGNPGCGGGGSIEPGYPGAPSACAEGHATDAEGRCDFVVDGACFDSAESACACAGCEMDRCVVLESYPAQVGCL